MGVQKNATYKVHNGTDFDEINFKTIGSQVKMNSGRDLEQEVATKADKATVTFVATLIDKNELAGAYTRLKFIVNKNITSVFPQTSNAYRIFDDGNGLRDGVMEGIDTSNGNYNIMKFLVNGGDVRASFTAGRVYTIL